MPPVPALLLCPPPVPAPCSASRRRRRRWCRRRCRRWPRLAAPARAGAGGDGEREEERASQVAVERSHRENLQGRTHCRQAAADAGTSRSTLRPRMRDDPDPSGPIRPAAVEAALRRIEGGPVELVHLGSIADDRAATELKHIGYGEPALVRYRAGGREKRCVLHTMAPNWFGHDRRADRAALVLLAADTYGELPRHTRVLDVGAFDAEGSLVSLAGEGEFYLLTEYAEGTLYARDLRDLELRGEATPRDLARARALAAYLADLHRAPEEPGAPEIYQRAVRNLVGSGEGVFGIADSYPEGGPVPFERLAALERALRRLPLEDPRPRPPPPPHARRLPPLQHPVPRGRRLHPPRRQPRRPGRPRRRPRRADHQLRPRRRRLPRCLAPRARARVGGVLVDVPRRERRPRGPRGHPPLLRLARPRGGEPGLVPEPDAGDARRAARVRGGGARRGVRSGGGGGPAAGIPPPDGGPPPPG